MKLTWFYFMINPHVVMDHGAGIEKFSRPVIFRLLLISAVSISSRFEEFIESKTELFFYDGIIYKLDERWCKNHKKLGKILWWLNNNPMNLYE